VVRRTSDSTGEAAWLCRRPPGYSDSVRLEPAAAVAQAWFTGLNPMLGDRSSARPLREGDLADVGPHVLAAAREFAQP
jgi:hypothetical protein